jgi:hypothetical protein
VRLHSSSVRAGEGSGEKGATEDYARLVEATLSGQRGREEVCQLGWQSTSRLVEARRPPRTRRWRHGFSAGAWSDARLEG